MQSRITAVAMITAVAVLLAACAAFIAEQWRNDRQHLLMRQGMMAQAFAGGPTVLGVYEGHTRAADAIERLSGFRPEFMAVFLTDRDGHVLAGSGAPSIAAAQASNWLEARRPVVIGRRPVGELLVYAAPPTLWTILPRYLALIAALLSGASALSLLLGRWLAGRVTDPVNRLSNAMQTVAAGGDFTQRVERRADDELGRLTDSFNQLLAKLHDHDQALKATMAELMQARDSAESANRLKSQFLANMSHEIRTPLNGLLAMSQVMALEDMGEVQRGRLNVIRQSGETLLSILNDVLDVSKIEAGKLELEVDDFDTETVLRSAVAPFGPVAERKGLGLVLDVRGSAAGLRRGDATRLSQIVGNLVSNALKFTTNGEVRITAEGQDATGAAGIVIQVADTGIGIPPEALPILFQTFTQADSSTTRRFGGTGLGLAICQELSELMGGAVSVRSEPGTGSVFSVSLPLERVAAPRAPAADTAASQMILPREDRPLKVLAAEDNPTNQLVLSTVMGVFGVELSLVGDGKKALEAWRGGTFDLILMDIQMPEMDGLAATRAIRAEEAETGRARIPIIALSAHAMTHQIKEYLAAGVDLHVPKPIELPRLQAALDAAMRLCTPADATAAGEAAA
ncbi:MAG TPA: ATP-binding protein [Caulobacteraceae bacterium]|nr:ATP-binding protein [Caulobacteraceae bacterium]